VGKALPGEADEIKGYTVATRVFGRREDFDQSTDPIVSIKANKLRRALEHYLPEGGSACPPAHRHAQGHLRNDVERQSALQSGVGRPKDRAEADAIESAWPTVLVQLFQNLTGEPELDYLADGLAAELATEITRYQDIRYNTSLDTQEDEWRNCTQVLSRRSIDNFMRKGWWVKRRKSDH
jgi:hypothetical protein